MTQLSTRDWETLSAYLDNQIETRERGSLELRLQNDPEFAQGLEELRLTCLVLKNCPKYRAPRNFTLSPQMAGKTQQEKLNFSLFPTLRLTSILAALFFVLISVGNLFVKLGGSESIAVSEVQNSNPQSGPLLGKGGGGGAAPAPILMPTAESFSLQAGESQDLLSEDALVVTPELENIPAEAPEQPMALFAPSGSDPELTEIEGEQAANPVISETGTPDTRGISISWILVLQVLLGIVALGAGMSAIYFRRKHLD